MATAPSHAALKLPQKMVGIIYKQRLMAKAK